MYMNEKDLQKLKEKLEKEAGEIEVELSSLKKHTDFGHSVDMEEETDDTEEFTNNLERTDVFKNRLADIELALDKINKGAYGTCENCKKEIILKLLEINPESRLCKECKLKTVKK